MVDQLNAFASEVTRVAREVGTEGRLGGQASVEGVRGTWKELTDNVNGMASNLTNQVRDIAEVTTSVARGDLTRKITVDAKGEILELKNTVNIMVDQLSSFADQVTRLARDVGIEGRLGGQADVRGVLGTWRNLTDAVNSMAANLTDQVRNIAKVATAIAAGDLQQKIVVEAKGEILELKNTDQHDGRSAVGVRRPGDARRSRGRHRRQARWPGLGRRRPRYVEGADRQRQPDGVEPDQPGPRHLGRRDRDRARRHDAQDLGRGPRRAARPQERHQHDGRHAVARSPTR